MADARTDPAAQARAHRQGPGRGRARPAALPGGRGPRQVARGHVRRPAGGGDQVPQRLPLPDRRLGGRRHDRLARGCRRDRGAAGAARLELRAVCPDHAQDLLGGIGPHHAWPRRRGDDGHGLAAQRAAIQDALDRWWAPAHADARTALPARDGPRPPLEDQGQDIRGAPPGVPDHLRAADPRDRPGHPGPRAALRRERPDRGSTRSPTGRSCAPS